MALAVRGIPQLVRTIAVVAVLAVVAGLVYVFVLGGGNKSGTAYFSEVKSVYPGDSIRILGIKVGGIDKITPEANRIRVDFHYNSKYSLPANVHAAIVSPTLVATRFIQLDPAYNGQGPTLPSGGVIPVDRTTAPVEFDELKTQLSQLSDALGPNGLNKDGSLNRALTVINKNGVQDGVGQGQNFHDMITALSKAANTLNNGRGDLFGTVRNLATFSSVLNTMDSQIVTFDHQLADATDELSDSDDELRTFLPQVDVAGMLVDRVLNGHYKQLTHTIDTAAEITRTLARSRMNIAQVLHVGPNVLTDFNNIWHPSEQRLVGTLALTHTGTLGGPGDNICALMTQASSANEKQGQEMCVKYLGPVFKYLAAKPPPLTINGVDIPRGKTAPYGDLEWGQANTNGSPNGTNEDLPRSSTANHNDRTYDGPSGLPGLMGVGQK
jgi:phospholipid/cholesterol/gamma-HCH transport system substrate-binding protein